MARVSQLFDVINKVTVDALIKPKSIGECALAAQNLLNVLPNDLILLDRGCCIQHGGFSIRSFPWKG
jgi:hypothetical protein